MVKNKCLITAPKLPMAFSTYDIKKLQACKGPNSVLGDENINCGVVRC